MILLWQFFSYFWNLELFRKYYLYFYYKVVPFKYTSRKFNKLKVKSWEIDLLYIGSLSGNYDDFSKSEINDFRKTTRWDRELGILNRIIWFWLWSGGDAFWKKEKIIILRIMTWKILEKINGLSNTARKKPVNYFLSLFFTRNEIPMCLSRLLLLKTMMICSILRAGRSACIITLGNSDPFVSVVISHFFHSVQSV